MTLTDWMHLQNRTYRRARAWQLTFNSYAEAVEATGLREEATSLRKIGERAWIVADRVVDKAFKEVV